MTIQQHFGIGDRQQLAEIRKEYDYLTVQVFEAYDTRDTLLVTQRSVAAVTRFIGRLQDNMRYIDQARCVICHLPDESRLSATHKQDVINNRDLSIAESITVLKKEYEALPKTQRKNGYSDEQKEFAIYLVKIVGISARDACRSTGISTEYIRQLCREATHVKEFTIHSPDKTNLLCVA
jgi:hypothetical protein